MGMITYWQLMEKVHDNTFTHENELYDLTELNKIMKHRPTLKKKCDDLKWIFKYDNPNKDHPERIKKSHLSVPIFVTLDQGQWVVVDGLHRLAKAISQGITHLPAKVVTKSDLKKCKVSL